MSARSAQCEECTTVFDVESTTGRLPTKCPGCRKAGGAAARPKQQKKEKTKGTARRQQKRKTPASSAPAIASAIRVLEKEIESLEGQLQQRQDARDALQAIA